MLVARLSFSPTQEDADGNGWRVEIGLPNTTPTVTHHATITAAQDSIKEAFQGDPDVDAYFQAAAEAEVLGEESAAVAIAKEGLLTAEGL